MKKISPTARQRFGEKYRVDAETGCWLWTAAKMPKGYGIFSLFGSGNFYAHRASWILHRGEIPAGLNVLHHCDVPGCVNPEHLFVGTQKDNMQDALKKGRCYIQSQLTHCKRGHEMTLSNVYLTKVGRACAKCQIMKVQRQRSKNRERYLQYMRQYNAMRRARAG